MQKNFITATPDSGGNGTTTVTVVASANSGNARTTTLNIGGGGITRNISISQAKFDGRDPSSAPHGVYIQRSNGKLYLVNEWNTDWNNEANGVAVKGYGSSFVIAPTATSSTQWSKTGTLVSGCTTTTDEEEAKSDYYGKNNTDYIIAQFGTNPSVQYAANYCNSYTFKNGKKGYLPSLGQLNKISEKVSEVDACMDKINGTLIVLSETNTQYWSSTQYNATSAWVFKFSDGTPSWYVKIQSPGTIITRAVTDLT